MPFAQGRASQRCCVTELTLNPSALLLQLKSWLLHPWTTRDAFKSPIPVRVSFAAGDSSESRARMSASPSSRLC